MNSGRKADPRENDLWYWRNDVDYIEQLMQHEYPIDMLGMGESTKPRMYHVVELSPHDERWHGDFFVAHPLRMPAAQTQRFANVLGTDDVQITYIPRAGHFAGTDQPDFVADTIVNFIRRVKGRRTLADINLGNAGIWKGDERLMIRDLRAQNQITGDA